MIHPFNAARLSGRAACMLEHVILNLPADFQHKIDHGLLGSSVRVI
jgi:hypothetical protein